MDKNNSVRNPNEAAVYESRFSLILEKVFEKSPMQKKRIGKFVGAQGEFFREQAERFTSAFLEYLKAEGLTLDYAVDAYLKMCNEFVAEQIKFMKTGKYSLNTSEAADLEIYSNPEVMKSYMHGIILSQFLWKNHFLMLEFYIENALSTDSLDRYLEIGAGHGLFLSYAISKFPDAAFRVVDISSTSIEMAGKLLKNMTAQSEKIEFIQSDIRERTGDEKYDLVVMGEVLEHVDDPLSLLSAVRDMMTPDGRFFMSTCANCPAIDHVYLYPSVESIVDMIDEAGFRIVNDVMLSADNIPRDKWIEKRATINYASLLAHK